MLHIQLIALGVIAAALTASGCGGSSKTESATTAATATPATPAPVPAVVKATSVSVATGKPLTRTTLIARGDAICARTNTKISAISVGSEAAFQRVLPQLAIYDSSESNELGVLVPPASLAREWSRIINAAHLYSEYVNRIAGYANTKSFAGTTQLIHNAEVVHRQMAVIARRNGFKHCSKTG